jgi:hypothetical protein
MNPDVTSVMSTLAFLHISQRGNRRLSAIQQARLARLAVFKRFAVKTPAGHTGHAAKVNIRFLEHDLAVKDDLFRLNIREILDIPSF